MPEELSFVRRSSGPSSPTLRDVVAILFRQSRLLLIAFSASLLAVAVYGLLSPPYQAHMKLLVRRGRVDPVVTPTATAPEFQRAEISEEELNSEVEILRDEELLRRTVKDADLVSEGRSWGFGDQDKEVRVARAVRRLAQRLVVEPVRKTSLIAVSYDSADPAQAAKVLNVLAKAYLEKHQEVHRPLGEFHFFDQQMIQYRRGLEESEMRLLNFTRDQGVVSGALERDMALQKLSEVEASHGQIRVAMVEAEHRIQALQAKLVSFPERATTQVRISDNPQLLEKLKSKLLELELKRTALLTEFEPTYRLVQEVDTQIAEARTAIAAEERLPLRDETTEQDRNHEWAKSELAKAQVELSALQAREAATSILLSDSQKAARQLGHDAIKQQDLLRDMKAAEENYLLYMKKREEARIGDALDERGILNVTMAEQPTVPALPKRSKLTLGFLGVVLAGTFSTGLAFAADFLDPAFRTPTEVAHCLGAPVLASLARRGA
jgi:uncharacterized protein involved in exopolysaccharide biosynthesis